MERRQLLCEPGIGSRVVARLEDAGIHSLAQLRCIGIEHAVAAICSAQGSSAWANRHLPLERVLERALYDQKENQSATQ